MSFLRSRSPRAVLAASALWLVSATAVESFRMPAASAAPAGKSAAPVPLASALTGDAKAQYEAGRQIYAIAKTPKDYETARTNFQTAFELTKGTELRLLWSLAVCDKELGRRAQSFDEVSRYVSQTTSPLTEKERQQGNELLSILAPYVSKLSIQSSDDGVQLDVDGTSIGQTPLKAPVTIDATPHKLHASKAGMTPLDIDFTGVAGGTTVVPIAMQPAQGKVIVDVSDSALVQIDGKNVGYGHVETSVAAGPHAVHLSAKGKKSYDDANFVVEVNVPRTLNITLQDAPSSVPAWVWVAGGVVLAGGLTVLGYEVFKPDSHQSTIAPGSIGETTASGFHFR